MVLTIQWQRLVHQDGKTCDRCGGTQEELHKAIDALRRSGRPLGMEVLLEEGTLSPEECAKDIMESNRIRIAGRPLEDWLNAEVGASICGSCCSQLRESVECRTICVDGKTYEIIPAELIIKAGLMAVAEMIDVPSASPCCPAGDGSQPPGGTCCP